MKSFICNALAILTFSLVTTGNAYAESTASKAEAETLNNSWNNAFNNSDAALLASFYAENALLSPGNGKFLSGRTQIESLFKSFFDAGFNSHKLEIIRVDGDDKTLYQVAKWSASGTEKDGIAQIYSGITTSIYKKDSKGKWIAHSHVWNAGN